jgi:hypothetical protein
LKVDVGKHKYAIGCHRFNTKITISIDFVATRQEIKKWDCGVSLK